MKELEVGIEAVKLASKASIAIRKDMGSSFIKADKTAVTSTFVF